MKAPAPLARALSGEINEAEWNAWWILAWYITTIGWITYGLWAAGLITLPVAAGGWLIEHFLATYAGRDPRRRGVEAGPPRRAA